MDTDRVLSPVGGVAASQKVEANRVAEISLVSEKTYQNPFMEVELDAIVTQPDGKQLRVPAFWAGGNRWCFRYSSPTPGKLAWRTECSDRTNPKLHAVEGKIEVVAYAGDNPLYRHGPIRVAKDRRHFEHADGTPFFWLGDTWWKGLCKRLTWEGFQELTADRQAKGFSVVQIVCGVYPDEGLFEPRWENEGGKPYLTRDFSVVNPAYFEYADRRIKHLVEAGIVPAIVGGWGRPDCDGMQMAGVAGIKRHWRNLIARYGAYPTVWIIGGESGGPQWTEVARYVRKIDPYRHPATIHPCNSARQSVTDETVIDFDMLQTGHGDWEAARGAIPKLKAAYARKPVMPAVIGEYCYEGHMQTAFQDVQRYVFWGCMLSGAAGHTYGAAGIWHMGVEGDPGITPIYDWTTWKEGMNYPGSTQLGMGKRLLEAVSVVALRAASRNGLKPAVMPRAFPAKCVSSTCRGVAFTTGAASRSSSLNATCRITPSTSIRPTGNVTTWGKWSAPARQPSRLKATRSPCFSMTDLRERVPRPGRTTVRRPNARAAASWAAKAWSRSWKR